MAQVKKIVIGADHAGYELKEFLKREFAQLEITDVGTDSGNSVDYPDFGKAAARKIAMNEAEAGIVICGSGIGISIAANREPAVRCALCLNPEMAKLARQHNDANMVAIGARFTSPDEAKEIVRVFLSTGFEGGRHEARVAKLSE